MQDAGLPVSRELPCDESAAAAVPEVLVFMGRK